jgi:uncharacterized repeat protein (TIGR02543 family)
MKTQTTRNKSLTRNLIALAVFVALIVVAVMGGLSSTSYTARATSEDVFVVTQHVIGQDEEPSFMYGVFDFNLTNPIFVPGSNFLGRINVRGDIRDGQGARHNFEGFFDGLAFSGGSWLRTFTVRISDETTFLHYFFRGVLTLEIVTVVSSSNTIHPNALLNLSNNDFTYTAHVINSYPIPPDPVKAGHTFVGWSNRGIADELLPSDVERYDTRPWHNVVGLALFSVWRVNEYNIAFYADNGNSMLHSKTLLWGSAITQPADPAKDGYIFTGWFTDVERANPYIFSLAVQGDLNLYAGWKLDCGDECKCSDTTDLPPRYTISFLYIESISAQIHFSDARWAFSMFRSYGNLLIGFNGGMLSLPAPSDIEMQYNENWWVQGLNLGLKIIPFTVSLTEEEYNLLNTHGVEYIVFSGVSLLLFPVGQSPNNPRFDANVHFSYTLSHEEFAWLPTPQREGHTFVGWFVDSALTTPYLKDYFNVGETLHIGWRVHRHTLTFNANGGTNVSLQTVNWGTLMPAPVSTKIAYVLTGWYTDVELTERYNFSNPITSDLNLHASWARAYVTITFIVGREVFKSVDVPWGSVLIDAISAVQEQGDMFSAFYSNPHTLEPISINTVLTSNLTLYAQPQASGNISVGEWFSNNWLWFAIGGSILVLGLVALIVIIKLKKE